MTFESQDRLFRDATSTVYIAAIRVANICCMHNYSVNSTSNAGLLVASWHCS